MKEGVGTFAVVTPDGEAVHVYDDRGWEQDFVRWKWSGWRPDLYTWLQQRHPDVETVVVLGLPPRDYSG